MSNAELLMKEIEGLPADYMGEVLDFVGYLKHKAPPVLKAFKENGASKEDGAAAWVNPLKGRGKALGSKLTLDRFMEMQEADKKLELDLES
ncbi:hypothetical protein FACS189445_6310 [Spirochaetia bacterium]|nr:hypothetical protein FACS189445_6310 [Spirochaetia bacterium]